VKIAAFNFWENPEKIGRNLTKFSKILVNFAKLCKKSAKHSAILNENKMRLEKGAKECNV
jgi:hypothetical protein